MENLAGKRFLWLDKALDKAPNDAKVKRELEEVQANFGINDESIEFMEELKDSRTSSL